MVRKMYGEKLGYSLNTRVALETLGLKEKIMETIRQGSMIWLGHLFRKNPYKGLKQAWEFVIEGNGGRGR